MNQLPFRRMKSRIHAGCFFLLFFPCLFLFCGIEEYYYLPQVPESNVVPTFNTEAAIDLPSMTQYYYFTNYIIYYRIYISEQEMDFDNPSSYTADFKNDYNLIRQYADPAGSSSSASIDQIFKNRNYHELRFQGKSLQSMLVPGSTLKIIFPTGLGDSPYAFIITDSHANLNRSITDPQPSDRLFLNSVELRTGARNADVAKRAGSYAYVSMYIAATGFDSNNFRAVFSKPTHINLFKLPDRY